MLKSANPTLQGYLVSSCDTIRNWLEDELACAHLSFTPPEVKSLSVYFCSIDLQVNLDNPTRWNSTYLSLQRVLTVRKRIDAFWFEHCKELETDNVENGNHPVRLDLGEA